MIRRGERPVSVKASAKKTRSKRKSIGYLLLKRGMMAATTAATFAIGLTLLSIALGVSFPKSEPAKTSTTTPNLTTAIATTKSCSRTDQADPEFATCPSFFVDYSRQIRGTLNPYEFNVYIGQPVANSEAQYYTAAPNNLRIENGSLILEARQQTYNGYRYTSARLDTHGKEDFLYGKLVIRAMLPTGVGTWPAIWMLPSQPKYASKSPASDTKSYLNDGEIDIAESIGLEPHVVYGVAHSVAYPEDGPDRSYYSTITVPGNDRSYHNYEVDWTPTSITFRIDDNAFYTYHKKAQADWRSWPFDQPYYLIINLALGGSWAGSDTLDFPGDGIDKRVLPASLRVQSIYYYPYAGKTQGVSAPAINQ